MLSTFSRVLTLTWLIVRLVVVFWIGEGKSRVLVTGHSWAAAGLYPSLSAPQLDGSLWRERPLWVRVSVGACAEGIPPLEEAQVRTVGNSSRVRSGSGLAYSQLSQSEVTPCEGEKKMGLLSNKTESSKWRHSHKQMLAQANAWAYLANKPTVTRREAR